MTAPARDAHGPPVRKRGDVLAILLLVAVWTMVVALVGLGGDFPLNDDWAYAYSARHLLHTGELRILDWAAPSLATHALWGAGLLRLFGDSYVVLRCGTLLWALSALLSLYGLARCALEPRAAIVAPLALSVSPWFVSLAFTYMTDVPWLAMMLAALLAFVRSLRPRSAEPPRPALLLLCGALIGAAALTRQFSVITTPAFVLVLCLDARERSRRETPRAPRLRARWVVQAARDCLYLGAPVAAIFLPFQLWYIRVHGATVANRQTLAHMLEVRPWVFVAHVVCVLHYAGLWLFPLALVLLLRSREVVTRRPARWAFVLLAGYAAAWRFLDHGGPGNLFERPADMHETLMPYLGNIFGLAYLGTPSLTDVCFRDAPQPHSGIWLGRVLTVASTVGGVICAGLLATTVERVRWTLAKPSHHGDSDPGPRPETPAPAEPAGEDGRRGMLRVLLVSFACAYLLFQLCTVPIFYDRYLLPLLPVVFLLGLDAMPPSLARSPVIVACLVVIGLCSVAGTREYLSWNGARDRAVRELVARGVPAAEIDGGFEINAPLHFAEHLKRTGKLMGKAFWLENAPYRVSFWPSHTPECTTEERYPYWTWPGGGDRALYVERCSPPAGARAEASP